nr:glycosyltransferase family 2 protein [uncultured Rhodoferax sp.]
MKLNLVETGYSAKIRLCVLLTCFNRKEKTLACFAAIQANVLPSNIELTAVVVDDGSTDGTAEAMTEKYPWARVERSTNNLYWCRGMHQAFEIAQQSSPDFYVWLNDDTMLQPDALARLIATEQQLRATGGTPVVVVGSTTDEHTGALTYGGCARLSGLKRMRFALIPPTDVTQRCDAMNGNVVLVSKEAAAVVGNLDPVFEHAMGDTDYALRANKLGVQVWVAPGVHGTCSKNTVTGTYMDASLAFGRRWKLMMHRKGLPWRSWLALTSRHAGPAWPLYFVWPYMSLILGFYKRKSAR